jgi:transposase InsO family protein
LSQPRSTQRYRPRVSEDEAALVAAVHGLVRRHPRYGYRRIWALLRADGWQINRKRVYRLWRREGFKVPRKQCKKRRLGSSVNGCVRRSARWKDDVWAWDFIHDRDACGRPLKWLSLVDEYTRECLLLEVDRSITAADAVELVSEVMLIRGTPSHIRSDNGPEFIAVAIREFLAAAEVETLYVEPGSPWENGYAESFHSRLRDELLDAEVFEGLRDAKALAASWQNAYNHRRPHSSLGYRTPAAFAADCSHRTNGKDDRTGSPADPPVGASPLPPAQPAAEPLTETLTAAGT